MQHPYGFLMRLKPITRSNTLPITVTSSPLEHISMKLFQLLFLSCMTNMVPVKLQEALNFNIRNIVSHMIYLLFSSLCYLYHRLIYEGQRVMIILINR